MHMYITCNKVRSTEKTQQHSISIGVGSERYTVKHEI